MTRRLVAFAIPNYSADTLGAFVRANLVPGSTAISDGWSDYARLKDVKHQPKIVGPMAAPHPMARPEGGGAWV